MNGHHAGTNGTTTNTTTVTSSSDRFIDHVNRDDPDYIRELQRPADVSEDMQEMNRRERVTAVLKSQAFRDELESIIQDALKTGANPTSLLALQKISDLVLPQNRFNQTGALASVAPRPTTVIPIADIRGVDTLHYTKGEKLLRCKLSALYRLVDLLGWSHGIYNHITVRISQEEDEFLINPFGLLYQEITASSLVKVDLSGQIIDAGSTTLGINLAGYLLHSAIHGARPDIRCVIHFHTGPVVAVSCSKHGLLPISQEAAILGNVSYHDYNGILIDETERDKIIRNLGPFNKVMILRNHGAVACGATIEEAFHYAFNLMTACEAQAKAMSFGVENLIVMSDETKKKTFDVASKPAGGVDSASSQKPDGTGTGRRWKTGELEFEAWMRMLDNLGYRTGYIYRHPFIHNEQYSRSRMNQDVEIPPASTSASYDDDTIGSLLKEYLERKKAAERVRWLNSPNSYQKVELVETGTVEPKKVTKWVQDNSTPSPGGTPIKLNNLQFSPMGTDINEFKRKQREMKEKRSQGIISSGPDSKVLEGITWDEADRIPDSIGSGAGDKLITVGAVSKGIIRRDQQLNVGAYKTTYQRNPFDAANAPEDVEKYLLEVERKNKHDTPSGDDYHQYEVRMETSADDDHRQHKTSRVSKTPPPTPAAQQDGNFSRSKSDRFPKDRAGTFPMRVRTNNSHIVESPSGDGEASSEPNSPVLDKGMRKSDTLDSSELSDKKKKKKGFRIPSFSIGRKKSKDSASGDADA